MASSIASPVALDPERYRAFLRDMGDIDCNGMTIIYLICLVRTHPYFNGADHLGLVGKIPDAAGFSWFMLEVLTMLTHFKRSLA